MAEVEKNTQEKEIKPAPQVVPEEVAKNASAQGRSASGGKKPKRQILKGRANIQCTYNNTIVTIADPEGGVLGWSSSGHLGFKGAKKSTPYAATQVVAALAEKVKKYGLQELEVFVKGVGSGREASIRALANNGFNLTAIKDITPIPHNGCRPRRPRRI